MSCAVDADRALGDVVQPRQQRGEHRLARTGRADQRQRLPGLDVEVDVAQRPVVVGASGNRKPTSTSSSRPPRGGSLDGPSAISRGASKISAIRLAAVNDSCVIDSRKPSDAIGHTSDSIIVMNATSVPIVT